MQEKQALRKERISWGAKSNKKTEKKYLVRDCLDVALWPVEAAVDEVPLSRRAERVGTLEVLIAYLANGILGGPFLHAAQTERG